MCDLQYLFISVHIVLTVIYCLVLFNATTTKSSSSDVLLFVKFLNQIRVSAAHPMLWIVLPEWNILTGSAGVCCGSECDDDCACIYFLCVICANSCIATVIKTKCAHACMMSWWMSVSRVCVSVWRRVCRMTIPWHHSDDLGHTHTHLWEMTAHFPVRQRWGHNDDGSCCPLRC